MNQFEPRIFGNATESGIIDPDITEVVRYLDTPKETDLVFWEDLRTSSILIGRNATVTVAKNRGKKPSNVHLAFEGVVRMLQSGINVMTAEDITDELRCHHRNVALDNTHQHRAINEVQNIFGYITGRENMDRKMVNGANVYRWIGGLLLYRASFDHSLSRNVVNSRQARRGIGKDIPKYDFYRTRPGVLQPERIISRPQLSKNEHGEYAFPSDATSRDLTTMVRDILSLPEATMVSHINASKLLLSEAKTRAQKYKKLQDALTMLIDAGYIEQVGSEIYARTAKPYLPSP